MENVSKDVYDLMDTKEIPEGVNVEQVVHQFGENVKEILLNNITNHKRDNRKLRMSNIGKKDRQLWYSYNGYEGEPLQSHTRIKFLYGHLVEEMILALVKLSGHEVTAEQKMVEVDGIKGSMDCKIDGLLVDVKSASTYGFKKFREGTLANDDPFGYVDQIKGYAHAEGERKFGWLAMDKTNGHLTLLKYDLDDESSPHWKKLNYTPITDRISQIKKAVEQKEPPERCYEDVADGKSGNMKLSLGCSYCAYKHDCHPGLRTFLYSNGPRYLTNVAKEPNVKEIDKDGKTISKEKDEFFS